MQVWQPVAESTQVHKCSHRLLCRSKTHSALQRHFALPGFFKTRQQCYHSEGHGRKIRQAHQSDCSWSLQDRHLSQCSHRHHGLKQYQPILWIFGGLTLCNRHQVLAIHVKIREPWSCWVRRMFDPALATPSRTLREACLLPTGRLVLAQTASFPLGNVPGMDLVHLSVQSTRGSSLRDTGTAQWHGTTSTIKAVADRTVLDPCCRNGHRVSDPQGNRAWQTWLWTTRSPHQQQL